MVGRFTELGGSSTKHSQRGVWAAACCVRKVCSLFFLAINSCVGKLVISFMAWVVEVNQGGGERGLSVLAVVIVVTAALDVFSRLLCGMHHAPSHSKRGERAQANNRGHVCRYPLSRLLVDSSFGSSSWALPHVTG